MVPSRKTRDTSKPSGRRGSNRPGNEENPGKIGDVERFHAPFRIVSNRVYTDTITTASETNGLRIAIFAGNVTV